MKRCCGIYKIKNNNSRRSYKIFSNSNELEIYLQKNKSKICDSMKPVFVSEKYKEFKNTQVRKLTHNEIEKYMVEKQIISKIRD